METTRNTNSPSAEQVCRLAGITTAALAVAAHERGYTWLAVTLAPAGEIVDAEVRRVWSANESYAPGSDWRIVYRAGTGSVSCNCDACQAGDDPADWAGDSGTDAVLGDIGEALSRIAKPGVGCGTKNA